MSFAKTMAYEKTKVSTKPSKVSVKKAVKNNKRVRAESLSGAYLTWHLLGRYTRFTYKHRVGYLVLSNTILVAYLVAHHMGKV
jgi:hypothetical protein